ncbi:hypothetical protein [Cellulomonas sp. P5_C5]
MPPRSPHAPAVAALGVLVLALGACTSGSPGPGPTPTTPPGSASSAPPVTRAASPSTASMPLPGDPCDPADGSPDCTDATADSEFRYIEGYAACVASFTTDERYGLCTDLDGDGLAGYPDSG